MKIDMDAIMDARDSINSVSKIKISFNDLVIKACAVGLKEHPQINAAWMEDRIRYNQHVHVGVAVAVPDGLLVPVVRFADTKRLGEISSEVKDFVLRANDKKLQPADWAGNTFTVSNLGMFGIDEFTAIINTPDSCIMAVGGIEEIPVVKNGQIIPGNVMKVTLSCDHRVVDGASGAKFLKTFKKLMENPVLLLGSYSI
ncbi:MAG: pyruvate dehydrogenase E2 component (dihydrolipoamide acetyltransferase) [Bacteroidia bacterium]|jgi:pyruvate dehydrogenase E2 component (dihydrolipoamide acetyltransferase)